jgi:hypothetical protein
MEGSRMRVFPVCLVVCLLVVLGLSAPSQAEAANYFVESVPVYQLDILDDQDPDTFSYVVDCAQTLQESKRRPEAPPEALRWERASGSEASLQGCQRGPIATGQAHRR